MVIIKQVRNFFIGVFAIGYFLFEEILWKGVAKHLYDYIHINARYEALLTYICYRHRFVILFVFLANFIGSEIMGIIALSAFTKGMLIFGVIMYAAKFIPVIVAFAILERGKHKLLTIVWFSYSYYFVTNNIKKLKNTEAYLSLMIIIDSISSKVFGIKDSLVKKLFDYSITKVRKNIK